MSENKLETIKRLRKRTGVGMGDCKAAFDEAKGNEEEAIKIIKKKGLVKVVERAGAIATEGVIYTYKHPGNKLAVILELNCQTDFVAKSDIFLETAENLGMHIASMNPLYISKDDILEEKIEEQKEIFLSPVEDNKGKKLKSIHILQKIADGKLVKWKKDICLLDQIFVIDNKTTIQQLLDDLSVKVGEKIVIRRFNRYELGEGL